jgi:hypothetical protein
MNNHIDREQDSEQTHSVFLIPCNIINEIIMPSWHFYATCHSLWDLVPEQVLESLLRVKASNNFKRNHAYTWAARIRSEAIFLWLQANKQPMNKFTCLTFALERNLDALKWARSHQLPWDASLCRDVASYGYLEILQWARANGCPWDKFTCAYAAQKGHLDLLKWARENGCPWDECTCAYAAENAHLGLLKWARENGCPWNEWTSSYTALKGPIYL